jgi:hypothetical protein
MADTTAPTYTRDDVAAAIAALNAIGSERELAEWFRERFEISPETWLEEQLGMPSQVGRLVNRPNEKLDLDVDTLRNLTTGCLLRGAILGVQIAELRHRTTPADGDALGA